MLANTMIAGAILGGFSQFLIAVAATVTAVVVIGGALALVRGSYNKARIAALREDVGDFQVRLKSCEEQLDESKAREAALKTKVEYLEQKENLLTALVTQRADVEAVLEKLNEHHEAAMAGQQRLIEAVEALAGAA